MNKILIELIHLFNLIHLFRAHHHVYFLIFVKIFIFSWYYFVLPLWILVKI